MLFVKYHEAETTTKSGIILTDNSKERRLLAEVINVGSKVSGYSAHDTVIFREYAATEIKLEGEDYLLVDQRDILGKVVER